MNAINIMKIINIIVFIILFLTAITYLPSNKNSLDSTNTNSKTGNNVFVVGLVLEWYPIDDQSAKQGWIFENMFNWLKEGDFKIVPLFPWYSNDQVSSILSLVNSVLWMGGMQNLTTEVNSNLEKYYKHVLDEIEKLKLPALLVCQGFQIMSNIYANKNILQNFKNNFGKFNSDYFLLENNAGNATSTDDTLFSAFSNKDFEIFQTKNVNYHYHQYGVTLEDYQSNSKLSSKFKVSTYGKDEDGKSFVNSVYHKELPIHAIQFHPERSNSLKYKENKGEDYKESRIISFKLLKGFKNIVKTYNEEYFKLHNEKNFMIDDDTLTSLYEISTLNLFLSEDYDTGTSKLKGYMFNKEDYPFNLGK